MMKQMLVFYGLMLAFLFAQDAQKVMTAQKIQISKIEERQGNLDLNEEEEEQRSSEETEDNIRPYAPVPAHWSDWTYAHHQNQKESAFAHYATRMWDAVYLDLETPPPQV